MKNFDIKVFSDELVICAYEVLEVELCANFNKVKKAYHKLARAYHPDKNNAANAAEIFKNISNAFEYIQNYKSAIEANKTSILDTAKQPKTAPIPPSQQATKDSTFHRQWQGPNHASFAKEQEAKRREQEAVRREQEAIRRKQEAKRYEYEAQQRERAVKIKVKQEIDSLLRIFDKVKLPNDLNESQTHQYLIRKCRQLLLNEADELKKHTFDMIYHLEDKKRALSQEIEMLIHTRAPIIFPPDIYWLKQKEITLKHYSRQLDYDLSALKFYQADFDSACKKLNKDACFSSIIALDSHINLLNSEIANSQLKNYYLCEFDRDNYFIRCSLPHELTLNHVTRLTDQFIRTNQDLSAHFTGICAQGLHKVSEILPIWEYIDTIKMSNSPNLGFPACLVKLPKLKEITLEGNTITTLPETLGNATQLFRLNLSNNNLSSLPQSLAKLNNLSYLKLSHNLFEQIPTEISKLCQLKELDFANTKISQIPETMKELVNLEKLHLSGNTISYLPETVVANWKKLENLNISNNSLVTLPKNIGDMASLKVVDARYNNIPFIPSSILKLKGKLESCYLDQNLLHHHADAVAAILNLMGMPMPDQLLSTQTFTSNYPMTLDNYFSFDQDEDLINISNQYFSFMNTCRNTSRQEYPLEQNYNGIKISCF